MTITKKSNWTLIYNFIKILQKPQPVVFIFTRDKSESIRKKPYNLKTRKQKEKKLLKKMKTNKKKKINNYVNMVLHMDKTNWEKIC